MASWAGAAQGVAQVARQQQQDEASLEQQLADREYRRQSILVQQAQNERLQQQMGLDRDRFGLEKQRFEGQQQDTALERNREQDKRGVMRMVGELIRTQGITPQSRQQIVGMLAETGQTPTMGQILDDPDADLQREIEKARQVGDINKANQLAAIAAQGAETRRTQAARPAAEPRAVTPTAALNATRQLRNDFTRETASARTVQQQLALMKSSLAAVQAGAEAPGSQGVLVTFQKILDPTSVVRESEYARSASGLSLLGRLEGQWMKISQGGAGVTPGDLAQFVSLAEQFAQNQARFANETKQQVDAMATRFGLDPALITREFPDTPPQQAQPASPASGGAASPPVQKWGRDSNGRPVRVP
jgi:hypothetical protein